LERRSAPKASAFSFWVFVRSSWPRLKQVVEHSAKIHGKVSLSPEWTQVSFDELLAFHFVRPRTRDGHQFVPDMKNILILLLLIPFAICSCQKQDSAGEAQLAQRKTELEAREKALDERVNSLDERVSSLDERVKELAEKQRATASNRVSQSPDQVPNPARVQGERDRTLQHMAAEIRARMPNDLKMKAERDKQLRAQHAQGHEGVEQLQMQRQRKLQMSTRAVLPSAETSSPTPSPGVETSSPPASPATEVTSPTQSPTPQ
jgi:hypothetical protein